MTSHKARDYALSLYQRSQESIIDDFVKKVLQSTCLSVIPAQARIRRIQAFFGLDTCYPLGQALWA